MKQLTIHIPAAPKEYPITIGNNLIEHITDHIEMQKYSRVFVITDEAVAPLFLEKLVNSLPEDTLSCILPSGEKEKTIESIQKIWTAMKDAGLDRKSLVINLGGGVIGDMGGFAASTYMRGINFLQIPTTLLSQIDASVGGKTGIDFAGIKNIIGSFQQPVGVIIDVQTLKTLPKREFISGFAEIIKHGLIADKKYYETVTSKTPVDFSEEELVEIIAGSCEIKKKIVQQDETEVGLRKLLNFGHTIGHAIESLSLETEHPLLHGEAVSIGMVAETKISQLQNLISEEDLQKIKNKLANANLPTSVQGALATQGGTELYLHKMQSDKKNVAGKINFTLLTGIGKAKINQTGSDEIIEQALAYIFE